MNTNNTLEGIRQEIKDKLFAGIDPKETLLGKEEWLDIVNQMWEDMNNKETEVDLEIEERLVSFEKVDKNGAFKQAYVMICEIENMSVRIDMK